MEDVVRTLSSLSCEVDETTTKEAAAAATETDDTSLPPHLPLLHRPPHSESPDSCNSNVGSPTNSASANKQVALALAAARRKRSDTDLQLPSLSESRNDREWTPFRYEDNKFATPFSVHTTCSEDGAEWEVSLTTKHRKDDEEEEQDDDDDDCNVEEEKKVDSSLTLEQQPHDPKDALTPTSNAIVADHPDALSPETLERRTERIIMEAKMETMRWRQQSAERNSPSSFIESSRRQELIRQALDRAASKTREAALLAVLDGSSVTGEEASSTSQALTPKMRSTAEVMSLVSRTLSPAPVVPSLLVASHWEGSDHHVGSSLPSPHSGVPRPPPTPDGRPPLSPLTPMTPVGADPYTRFQPSPTAAASTASSAASKCLSPAESSMASLEDYEKAMSRLLPNIQLTEQVSDLSREKILRRIDGIVTSPQIIQTRPASPVSSIASTAASLQFVEEENSSIISSSSAAKQPDQEATGGTQRKKVKKVKTVVIKSAEPKKEVEESSFGSWFNFLWGGAPSNVNADSDFAMEEYEESLAPMSCGRQRLPLHEELPIVPTSLVRVASREEREGYAEAINAKELYIDPRMPEWIDNQFSVREGLPKDGTYQLGESRTVIVHELIRGSWTWCTAWSPDGRRLAIGTENHHLAVVDTYSSSVWRIKHDKRVSGSATRGSDATHSIRSIAWGAQFIAIGGVGSSVSILAPTAPYPILHQISPTGFVGSLHWLKGSNTLLIGSRNGKATIVKIWAQESDHAGPAVPPEREIRSTILHTIDRQRAWVNVAKFSPGGMALAVGDSKGILGVYSYEEKPGAPVNVSNIANFKLEDSILDIDWSPDGQWLYAGGEDFVVTVINTQWWEAVHRIKRDRWVQFIASSHGGSHVAIGGVSSEVSIMDVDRGWDTAINVSLKGLVPLSAQWHPQDQYLVVTGQNNSVLAVETTNSRYVMGHFLRSISPILAIEFSPDGRMAAIGNEAGVVTIFKLSGTTFTTTYELVLDGDGSLSIQWSLNGAYLAVVAGSKVVIVAKSSSLPGTAPPNASGFHVAQVIRDFGIVQDVAISPKSRYVAISGANKTRFLDATTNFKCVLEVEKTGTTLSNSWAPDGNWFATIGKNQNLLIYDTTSSKPSDWRVVFTVHMTQPGLALAWGPAMLGGLQYCAYGGEDKKIYIMEIRTKERTWETVLGIPREGIIHDLDWNAEGLVAAAIGNGTVTVMDLSYLQSGWAVNEMDYNWQRQALTCFTEIRRNKGKNAMKCVRWIPSAPGSDSLLAVGGTDGEVEIVDLTDRRRCSGFNKVAPTT